MICGKCGATSGNDWRQCKGSCPMPGSPHFSEGPLDPQATTELFRPPVKRKKPVREAQVEADHMARVKSEGGHSYKFVSPARRSVPDRLDLRPVPPEFRELVARYVRFTECKKPGEKPTPSQQREHEFLRALGFQVDVVDERTRK